MNEDLQNENRKVSVWSIVIKVIIAVATTLAGALGLQSCAGM